MSVMSYEGDHNQADMPIPELSPGTYDPLLEDYEAAQFELNRLREGGASPEDILLAKMDLAAKEALAKQERPTIQPTPLLSSSRATPAAEPVSPQSQIQGPAAVRTSKPKPTPEPSAETAEREYTYKEPTSISSKMPPDLQIMADAAIEITKGEARIVDDQGVPVIGLERSNVADYSEQVQLVVQGILDPRELIRPQTPRERKLAVIAIQALVEVPESEKTLEWLERFAAIQVRLLR